MDQSLLFIYLFKHLLIYYFNQQRSLHQLFSILEAKARIISLRGGLPRNCGLLSSS
jgi:hypothetical protein